MPHNNGKVRNSEMAQKESRKVRYTKMVLQDSLMELIAEKPFSKITIKELCERADINRSTFYAHYGNQHELLKQIEDETLSWVEEMVSAILAKTDERETVGILAEILRYVADNRKHIQVLMSEKGDIGFQKQLLTLVYRECGISPDDGDRGDAGGDSDGSELYFVFAVTGSVGLIQHWLKNGLKQSVEKMAETIYNLAFPIR